MRYFGDSKSETREIGVCATYILRIVNHYTEFRQQIHAHNRWMADSVRYETNQAEFFHPSLSLPPSQSVGNWVC